MFDLWYISLMLATKFLAKLYSACLNPSVLDCTLRGKNIMDKYHLGVDLELKEKMKASTCFRCVFSEGQNAVLQRGSNMSKHSLTEVILFIPGKYAKAM